MTNAKRNLLFFAFYDSKTTLDSICESDPPQFQFTHNKLISLCFFHSAYPYKPFNHKDLVAYSENKAIFNFHRMTNEE